MPTYDYECQNCGNEFSLDFSVADHDEQEKGRKIRCPKCESADVKHVFSSVFVTTSRKS